MDGNAASSSIGRMSWFIAVEIISARRSAISTIAIGAAHSVIISMGRTIRWLSTLAGKNTLAGSYAFVGSRANSWPFEGKLCTPSIGVVLLQDAPWHAMWRVVQSRAYIQTTIMRLNRAVSIYASFLTRARKIAALLVAEMSAQVTGISDIGTAAMMVPTWVVCAYVPLR